MTTSPTNTAKWKGKVVIGLGTSCVSLLHMAALTELRFLSWNMQFLSTALTTSGRHRFTVRHGQGILRHSFYYCDTMRILAKLPKEGTMLCTGYVHSMRRKLRRVSLRCFKQGRT